MDKAIKKIDLEREEELERRDQLWKNELKQRDQAYWQRPCKKDEDLVRIFEGRNKSLHDALVSRD